MFSNFDIWAALKFMSEPLFLILLTSFVFGAFGGLVAHFINNEKSHLTESASEEKPYESWFLYPSQIQSCLIGVAGAIAFLFFIIAVGGLTNFQTLTEQLRSIAVSVIAGFGARSLLPRMVGHLEKQVAEAKTEAVKASHDAREAIETAENARSSAEKNLAETKAQLNDLERIVQLNGQLIDAGAQNTEPQIWKDLLNIAQDMMKSGKASSAIWINTARVQRVHVSLDVAIETLNLFIKQIDGGKIEKGRYYHNAFFNRSCYYGLRFRASKSAEDKDRALSDILLCLQNAQNPASEIEQMRGDEQLSDIVALGEFDAIVAKYAAP